MRTDVAAVAGAREPVRVFADAVHIRVFQLFDAAVGLDPILHVVFVAAFLIAVEAEYAAPHLPQGAHRHARGTNRARAVGIIAHEQRQFAGGAVRLNRHFIDEIGGGHAPVRQSGRVGVDGDERWAVFAGEGFARNGVYASLYRVFPGHLEGKLFRAVGFRRAELLSISACVQAGSAQIEIAPRRARPGGNGQQRAQRSQRSHLQESIHVFLPPSKHVVSSAVTTRRAAKTARQGGLVDSFT